MSGALGTKCSGRNAPPAGALGFRRGRGAIAVTAPATLAASTVPGAVAASAQARVAESEHWGVIARNTIGSPVAALRDGPYGSYQVQGNNASSPPYGKGSLGIQVADRSRSAR
ncbi:hypothetical protein [Streptomyces sp. NPDC058751]|uniref:hypothetical protein n=1 Tax=Streptomyces sp. NPDC058751 TaxID=3346623 RepID=UPI00367E85E7